MRMLILCAIANAVFTIVVTKSWIFLPVREWLESDTPLPAWVFKLFTCPFCFSHWGALIITIFWPEDAGFGARLIIWFSIVGLTAPSMAGIAFSLNVLSSFEEDKE